VVCKCLVRLDVRQLNTDKYWEMERTYRGLEHFKVQYHLKLDNLDNINNLDSIHNFA